MSSVMAYPTGGQFLLEDAAPADVFTPEDFDETQRMIADTVREFDRRRTAPHLEANIFVNVRPAAAEPVRNEYYCSDVCELPSPVLSRLAELRAQVQAWQTGDALWPWPLADVPEAADEGG